MEQRNDGRDLCNTRLQIIEESKKEETSKNESDNKKSNKDEN